MTVIFQCRSSSAVATASPSSVHAQTSYSPLRVGASDVVGADEIVGLGVGAALGAMVGAGDAVGTVEAVG